MLMSERTATKVGWIARPARPNPDGAGSTSQCLLTLIEQLACQRGGGLGRSRSYRINERTTNHERRSEGAGQPLQPARRIDRIANHRERHAVLAADIAEDGWPVIEADTDGERRLPISL